VLPVADQQPDGKIQSLAHIRCRGAAG
jgi:hypothetical protein